MIARPLAARYDALFVDLDGVLYRGDRSVDGAGESIAAVRKLGPSILFLTNNSARTPVEVVAKLAAVAVTARPEEILTSAVATADLLRREGMTGRRAFVVGERGIREALTHAGIEVLDGEPERADLVVVGWDRNATYTSLKVAALLVEGGARLIGTNPDASYPAADGLWPGAGALLSVVTTTTGAAPTVVGKPNRPLFEAAAERVGAERPLVVGDRLDTDVAGGAAMGWDTLLVLSGASRLPELLEGGPVPTYLAPDVRALVEPRRRVRFGPLEAADREAAGRLLAGADVPAGPEGASIEGAVGGWLDAGDDADDTGGTWPSLVATARVDAVEAWGVLRSVAVDGASRSQGLGALVVAHAVAGARAALGRSDHAHLQGLALLTETAVPFFQGLGFEPVEREDLPGPLRNDRHLAQECPGATAMLRRLARD